MPRRADRVPLVLVQPTPSNERLCSLLSAKLFRQPAPPLQNRLPWQLFFDPRQRGNILLMVIMEENTNNENWPNQDFVRALKDYLNPSPHWFAKEFVVLGGNDDDKTTAHFDRRWSRWMTSLGNYTDVYIIVGSSASLKRVAQQLTDQPLNPKMKGIFSVLPFDKQQQQEGYQNDKIINTGTLPHIPESIFHWITQVNVSAYEVQQGVLAVAGHANTVCLCLPSWPPTSWLIGAVVWFASAVQIIDTGNVSLSERRARL